MTTAPAVARSATSSAPVSRWATSHHLPDRVSFYLQASIVVSLFAASAAPTPLYATYQAEWGFSPITTTVVFAAYTIAVLVALLFVGSLSDHLGRRPVLIIALTILAATTLLFVFAGGVPTLLTARIVQGLATGAAIGPVGAAMIDLDREKGVLTTSVAGPMGTALGAIISALLVTYLPLPKQLVYLVLLAVFALQALGVVFMRESVTPRAGALASLRVQFGMPRAVRRPFFFAVPVIIATWALAGLYGGLGPTLVHTLIGHNSYVLGALSLVTFGGCGSLTVLVLRNAPTRTVMIYGTLALIVGLTTTLVAISHGSSPAFWVGGVIVGTGFGAGYQAGIRSVMPLVGAHERAGVLSIVYVVSYLAMGVPTIIAGVFIVHVGVQDTARGFGIGVMILAFLALLGVIRRPAPAALPDPELAAELA